MKEDRQQRMAQRQRFMQQTRWCLGVMMLIWASLVQAAGVEVLAPPLPIVRNVHCLVLNASKAPLQVRMEFLDQLGQLQGGCSAPAVAPLQTAICGSSVDNALVDAIVCRVTSADGKLGDLRVTVCAMDGDACQMAVTAQ